MSHFKALWLFEIMFPMFIQEPEHRHRDEIQNQIGIFAKLLGASQFDSAVNICFKYACFLSSFVAHKKKT